MHSSHPYYTFNYNAAAVELEKLELEKLELELYFCNTTLSFPVPTDLFPTHTTFVAAETTPYPHIR